MEFHCTNCQHKLSAGESQVGRKGRCAKCQTILTVPAPAAEPARSPHDQRLLDLPPSLASALPTEADASDVAYAKLRAALGGRILEPEEIPQRRYPWPVDIFLYPLTTSAIVILSICVGGPFFLRVGIQFAKVATIHIPVFIIFWLVSLIVHWGAFILLSFYIIWYILAAMRDSAEGGIRAPNTGACTPGLGELLAETFRLLVCIAFYMLPAVVYWARGGGIDALFWTLFAAGGFALPMALLSVVMHESLRGLNPLLIARSILRTLWQYLLLVPFCYALCLIVPLAYGLILKPLYWHFSYALQAVAFCQMLIMAHLLGRFYFKNEERLYWDT